MKALLFTIGLGLSFNIFAQQAYICKHGELIRAIEIVYTTADKTLPCKVTYRKSTGTRTFWSTKTEIGYCESKAEEFANKKRNKGWTCTEQSELEYNLVKDSLTEGRKSSFF